MRMLDLVRKVFLEVLPRNLPDYEFRPGQLEMAEAVAKSLEMGRILLVEAGTGIGKSLAYLVPAICWATTRDREEEATAASSPGASDATKPSPGGDCDGENSGDRVRGKGAQRRVLVSTGTITLQEQLIDKDIPFLKRALDIEFQSALAKGKGNYLCKARLEQEMVQPSFSEFGIGAELERLVSSVNGDRAELDFEPGEVWGYVNVDDTCTGTRCRFFGDCYYFKARQALEDATLIVCNHALFLYDLRIRLETGGSASILPPVDAVIFDEAHNLEDTALRAMGIELSEERITRLTAQIRRSAYFRGLAPTKMIGIQRGLERIEESGRRLFSSVLASCPGASSRRTVAGAAVTPSGGGPSHLPASFRISPEGAAGIIENAGLLADELRALSSILDPLPDVDYDSLPEELARIRRLSELARRLSDDLELVGAGLPGVFPDTEATNQDGPRCDGISWVEMRRQPVLHWTPLFVDEVLGSTVFAGRSPIILASATMSVGGTFTHLRRSLGISDASEMIVDSPFDYENQCLLYLPVHLPEPGDPRFERAIKLEIEMLLRKTEGRAFVLSTSLQGMEEISEYLKSRLPWKVLKQGEKPKQKLLDEFREDVHSVLVGSLSFWEGVDVQGEALSCVVIDKLPFMVPSDPVVEARAEAFARNGVSPFMSLFLPEAVMRLKQGFGRLIRSQGDRGIVAILDKRVMTRKYGRWFIESLPKCRVATFPEQLVWENRG